MSKIYYFDYASSTPVDPGVTKKMNELEFGWVNPSAEYASAREARKIFEDSLQRIAQNLGVKSTEIVITSGGTEANNLALQSFVGDDREVLISSVEHASVIEPAKLGKHKTIKVKASGRLDIDDLKNKISDQTILVSVMLVNNEIGTIQPIREVAKVIDEVRKDRASRNITSPIYLHTDACQALNYIAVNPTRLGVDMMTVNSGKIYGPKSVGALYISSKVKDIYPQILGGGQQRSMRSGTENVGGVYGFSLALEKAVKNHKSEEKRIADLRDSLLTSIFKICPEAVVNGSLDNRIANNLNISFPDQDNERLMMLLDEAGVCVATGSACSASSDEPSHVLRAIGIGEPEIKSSLRITLGRGTDEEAISKLCQSLSNSLA